MLLFYSRKPKGQFGDVNIRCHHQGQRAFKGLSDHIFKISSKVAFVLISVLQTVTYKTNIEALTGKVIFLFWLCLLFCFCSFCSLPLSVENVLSWTKGPIIYAAITIWHL